MAAYQFIPKFGVAKIIEAEGHSVHGPLLRLQRSGQVFATYIVAAYKEIWRGPVLLYSETNESPGKAPLARPWTHQGEGSLSSN